MTLRKAGGLPATGLDATVLVHAAGVAVLLAATLGAYAALVRPAHAARAAQAERAHQAAQDAQDLKVLEDHTIALERLSRTLEERLVDTVELRTLDQLNRQVASVTELVEQQRLHVTRMDPGDPHPFSRYTLVPLRMSGQGTFSDVVSFLHALHQQCKDTEVRAFAVYSDAQTPTELVTFDLSLAWYAVQGTPGARTAIRQPVPPAAGAIPAGRDGGAVADVPDVR